MKDEEESWSCQAPKHPYFACMTFMFLFLPSPHMMSLYTDKASACVLNISWGFTFLIGGSLAIYFKKTIDWTHHETLELVFVFAPLGFYSLMCGLGHIGKIKYEEHLSAPEKLKYSLELLWTKKTLFYPLVFFLSPLISLGIYFRAIFRHNQVFANDYTECKYIESFSETSTQLCLQLYILMKTFHYKPSNTLWLNVILGIFSVGIPPTAKFLHHSRLPYRFFNYIKYYPIFFFNTVFRIFSWSIIFMFFYIVRGVLIMIASGGFLVLLNCLTMKIFFPDLRKEKSDRIDYRFQVGEMAVQNFLSIPNLRETKAARFCRKFSFYASLIFNIISLLVLLLLNHLKLLNHAYVCIIFSCEENNQIFSCDHDHHNYFTEVVVAVISIGLFGLVLDLIYACSSDAVFNIPLVNKNIIANDISKILSGPEKIRYKNSKDESVVDYDY